MKLLDHILIAAIQGGLWALILIVAIYQKARK